MSIEARLTRLESRVALHPTAPTAAEAAAAYERVALDARANFIARLKGMPVPLTEELADDYEMLRRYGAPVVLDAKGQERLRARLDELREDDLARAAETPHRSTSPEATNG